MSLIDNKYIHLTNIDINKYNRNFIKPNKTSDEKANTWNIMMYKKYLRKYNIKWSNIRNKIKDIINSHKNFGLTINHILIKFLFNNIFQLQLFIKQKKLVFI